MNLKVTIFVLILAIFSVHGRKERKIVNLKLNGYQGTKIIIRRPASFARRARQRIVKCCGKETCRGNAFRSKSNRTNTRDREEVEPNKKDATKRVPGITKEIKESVTTLKIPEESGPKKEDAPPTEESAAKEDPEAKPDSPASGPGDEAPPAAPEPPPTEEPTTEPPTTPLAVGYTGRTAGEDGDYGEEPGNAEGGATPASNGADPGNAANGGASNADLIASSTSNAGITSAGKDGAPQDASAQPGSTAAGGTTGIGGSDQTTLPAGGGQTTVPAGATGQPAAPGDAGTTTTPGGGAGPTTISGDSSPTTVSGGANQTTVSGGNSTGQSGSSSNSTTASNTTSGDPGDIPSTDPEEQADPAVNGGSAESKTADAVAAKETRDDEKDYKEEPIPAPADYVEPEQPNKATVMPKSNACVDDTCVMSCDKNMTYFPNGVLTVSSTKGFFGKVCNRTYFFSHELKTFDEAQKECCAIGMVPASIETRAEQDCLITYNIKTIKKRRFYWTSGTDRSCAKKFHWCTGPVNTTLYDWRVSQPNYLPKQHCLAMALRIGWTIFFKYYYADSGLNDRECYWKTYYMCEKP